MVVVADFASLDIEIVVQMDGPRSCRGGVTLPSTIVETDKESRLVSSPGGRVQDLDAVELVALPLLAGIEGTFCELVIDGDIGLMSNKRCCKHGSRGSKEQAHQAQSWFDADHVRKSGSSSTVQDK